MKKLLLIILLLFSLTNVFARHIKGGFFTYKYLGPGINNPTYLRYKITLTVFMDCDAVGPQINQTIPFTIYNSRTLQQVANPSVQIKDLYYLEKEKADPCIRGDQIGCYYLIVTYELTYELPVSADGYTVSYQRCCRIEEVENIVNSGDVGNTWTIKIPGTNSPVIDANKNNSPDFFVNDTIVVCQNNYFSYPFKAIDSDGDSLTYSLCSAYSGGAPPPGNAEPNPAATPPYSSVPYKSPYNSNFPLGAKVNIDPVSGLISGIAPPKKTVEGEYVITVCISEYRKGVFFAETRKELHLKVRNCDPLRASLQPKPVTCDGFTLYFSNDVATPSGTDHVWDFGDPISGAANISNSATPTHTFTDTGIYTVKLKVSTGGLCADSATLKVKIYPGFFPGFMITSPLCNGQPVQFVDTTKTNYGVPTGWRWNFANTLVTNDTSHLQNPTYTYPGSGLYKNVEFIVANTFGCIDTVYKDISILDLPTTKITGNPIICWLDTVSITATGNGSVEWSPNYMISSLTNKTTLISPDVSTKYFATLTDVNGCKNSDSFFVDVRTSVNVALNNDTTICKGDPITLNPVSDASNYKWSPPSGLDDTNKKSPKATPLSTTTYKVIANIGKCQNEDDIKITVVPYPSQQKAKDTTVCLPLSTRIYTSGGSFYRWSPTTFLSNANIADPLVLSPTKTTMYIVTVTDTLGCPKPTYDTFTVNVQKINTDAGPRDTAIVIGEPLYLNGTGADIYSWVPAKGLNNPDIHNPVATIRENTEYVLFGETTAGCKNTDTISIKVFNLDPDLYVPTAFSPNGDGLNDLFKPILLGVKKLNFFNVYNRWGQLVYSTNNTQHSSFGWDGTFGGKPQDAGTFVWHVEGVSYLNKPLSKKGYVVLVR